MRRLLTSTLSALLVILSVAFVGCDIHEYPVIKTDANPLVLHLNFDTIMPLHQELVYTKTPRRIRGNALPTTYDVRHIVSVHRLLLDGTYNRTADTVITYLCPNTDSLNCTRILNLSEGDYRFFVWTDYVAEGQDADLFYNTYDFAEIILQSKSNYIGNSNYRDAFRGEQTVSVRAKRDEITPVNNETTISIGRPLAKFRFISTDFDIFLEKALAEEASRQANSPSTGSSESDTETKTVDPNDYSVLFRYAEFMPCSYNMFTDHPADSWTGVWFSSALRPMSDTEVEMGFDYVFVNGAEAGVKVIVEVYNKDGVMVSSSPAIEVPLKRNHLTIVKGEFLTSIAQGGITIHTDFDGEYNIEIQ